MTDTLQLKKSALKFQSFSEIISFHENHDKISKMEENNVITKEFCFKEIPSNEVKKILNRNKPAIGSCIPVSILIESIDIYLPLLTDIIKDFLKTGISPDQLKLAEVILLFKKADPFDKTNY